MCIRDRHLSDTRQVDIGRDILVCSAKSSNVELFQSTETLLVGIQVERRKGQVHVRQRPRLHMARRQ